MQNKNCHTVYAHTPLKININGYDSAVLFSHLHPDGADSTCVCVCVWGASLATCTCVNKCCDCVYVCTHYLQPAMNGFSIIPFHWVNTKIIYVKLIEAYLNNWTSMHCIRLIHNNESHSKNTIVFNPIINL